MFLTSQQTFRLRSADDNILNTIAIKIRAKQGIADPGPVIGKQTAPALPCMNDFGVILSQGKIEYSLILLILRLDRAGLG